MTKQAINDGTLNSDKRTLTVQSSGVKVLFTGAYWPGSNSMYIARAFERCGVILRYFDDTRIYPTWMSKLGRISRRFLRPVIDAEWNRQLMQLVESFQPDLVYITNADFCLPSTIQAIRARSLPVMCFYHDVKWFKRPGSNFSDNISNFDLVVTTRHWHEPEFRTAGARDVMVVRFGYEPQVHRPIKVNKSTQTRYGASTSLIATHEAHRTHDLTDLVRNGLPYSLKIWGGLWNNLPSNSPIRPYWQGRDVHEQEIPIIYASSQVALHWVGWEPIGHDEELRRGDQHNSRTFQIPACGGAIMVAQRTPEHEAFFAEDTEAVFFSDVTELRDKLDYWLHPDHSEVRIRMSIAAHMRCVKEDYSYVPVVQRFLKYFELPST